MAEEVKKSGKYEAVGVKEVSVTGGSEFDAIKNRWIATGKLTVFRMLDGSVVKPGFAPEHYGEKIADVIKQGHKPIIFYVYREAV